jgi:hypothetical protein
MAMRILVQAVVIMGLIWIGAQTFGQTPGTTSNGTATEMENANPREMKGGVYRPPIDHTKKQSKSRAQPKRLPGSWSHGEYDDYGRNAP